MSLFPHTEDDTVNKFRKSAFEVLEIRRHLIIELFRQFGAHQYLSNFRIYHLFRSALSHKYLYWFAAAVGWRLFNIKWFALIINTDVHFGDKLLDIGSGPTTQSVLSASRRVKHIDLTDFTPRNLQVLRDWKTGKRNEVINLMKYEMQLADDKCVLKYMRSYLMYAFVVTCVYYHYIHVFIYVVR